MTTSLSPGTIKRPEGSENSRRVISGKIRKLLRFKTTSIGKCQALSGNIRQFHTLPLSSGNIRKYGNEVTRQNHPASSIQKPASDFSAQHLSARLVCPSMPLPEPYGLTRN